MLWLLLLVPISWVLTYLAKINPFLTEQYYSTTIYKYLSLFISKILGIIPFSVAEILLVFGTIFLIIYLIVSVYKAIRCKKIKFILVYLKFVIGISSVIYFIFTIFCGINYYRLNFEYYFDGSKREYSKYELAEMCEYLILTAGEIENKLSENIPTNSEMSKNASKAFNNLSEEYNVLWKGNSKPKAIILSNLMSYTEITGFYFPWTVEANINVAPPEYTIPFTMMHEQAHQRGFMREDEANFIAFLAGKHAEDNFSKYSAYMMASTYAMNSLYKIDKDLHSSLQKLYTAEQIEDLNENYYFWEKYENTNVSETFTEMNDNYLKSNGQELGVISYGKVTELLLMEYFKQNLTF